MKRLVFLWGGILSMMMISCGGSDDNTGLEDLLGDSESSASVYVDNGADTTVMVTITSLDEDGKTFDYEVEAYGVESTSLKYGKYHVKAVTVTDSLIVDEDFELNSEDYIYTYNLNLTKEDYVVENIIYTVNPTGMENYGKSFTYNGSTYEGWDADVIKGSLVVPKDWDYNLDAETPEEVSLDAGQNSTIRRKLWRASMFVMILELEMLLEEYGDDWSEE